MRAWAFSLLGCLALAGPLAARPLVSVMTTCSGLSTNTYPVDNMTWFDAGKQAQVVFFAHLLFPMQNDEPAAAVPLALTTTAALPLSKTAALSTTKTAASPSPQTLPPPPVVFTDAFYAQAEWQDPEGKRVALYGLTFPARAKSDTIQLQDRSYVPHTFAMAIGTRDLRSTAGQLLLPEKAGQYTVRLSIDGQPLGLAFFRMLKGAADVPKPVAAASSPALAPAVTPVTPAGVAAALSATLQSLPK